MEKWTSKEEIEEIIGALPLEHEIEVLNIYQNSPEVVIVGIAGFTSSLDLKIIGEAFGDEDVWVNAEGYELKLTIYIKEK
ncbi:hypothetical protein PIOMA14_II_0790 [Prevotella intermedia]|uniref:Uncharacterized protein n=1 Tax=Prevotella intermedia TaxID=28131 RepID=A0A0T7AQ72_PREIN|nr:hypothetical protein [Prevotella intermedia]BAU16662.1 hypothetical protein PIOMA14_I_0153 [Prevotella intermedia]BAU19294.1 hypothetical protein PIOMA14_II_0790 [Prevotella intermedia]